jgi:hypothetical protein
LIRCQPETVVGLHLAGGVHPRSTTTPRGGGGYVLCVPFLSRAPPPTSLALHLAGGVHSRSTTTPRGGGGYVLCVPFLSRAPSARLPNPPPLKSTLRPCPLHLPVSRPRACVQQHLGKVLVACHDSVVQHSEPVLRSVAPSQQRTISNGSPLSVPLCHVWR